MSEENTDRITTFLEGHTDTDNHTPAFKLWHYRFECTIAQMHLSTPHAHEVGGTISTGDREMDRELARTPVTVQLTPAAMATNLEEGVQIQVNNPQDAAKIYVMIVDHINDWVRNSQMNPNFAGAPVQDLMLLERLAEELYPRARYFLHNQPRLGRLAASVNRIVTRRGGVRRGGATLPEPTEIDNPLPHSHTNMTDTLMREDIKRRKPWS